jgi:hypothetical protein
MRRRPWSRERLNNYYAVKREMAAEFAAYYGVDRDFFASGERTVPRHDEEVNDDARLRVLEIDSGRTDPAGQRIGEIDKADVQERRLGAVGK